MSRSREDVASPIRELSIKDGKGDLTPQTPKKSKKTAVSDSWEDDLSSEEDNTGSSKQTEDCPSAPPPTPSSGLANKVQYDLGDYDPTARSEERSSPRLRSDVRPDKTDAAAKRMIAGALGIRAPRKTEEQKEYEAALRKKEARRRDEERRAQKAAEEAEEHAKAAVWDV